MKVVVDAGRCLGNALCESVAGGVFVVGEDSLARVLVDPVPERHTESVEQAVRMCPTQAIALED